METILYSGIVLFILGVAGIYLYDQFQEGRETRKAEREEARAKRQALLKSKPTVNTKTIPKQHRLASDKQIVKLIEDLSREAAKAGIQIDTNKRIKEVARAAQVDRSEIEELIAQIESRKIGKKK